MSHTKRPGSSSSGQPPSSAKGPYPGPEKVATLFFTRDLPFSDPPNHGERKKPGPVLDADMVTALTHCVHIALKLLEESTGRQAFIETAQAIVAERRKAAKQGKEPEKGLFAGKPLNDMPTWIDKFLSKIRRHGLPICVCSGLEGHYGLTQKWSWGFDMDKWDSTNSAVIYLNKAMVEGLLRAAKTVDECVHGQIAANKKIMEQHAMIEAKKVDKKTKDKLKADVEAEGQKTLAPFRRAHANSVIGFERSAFCISVTLAHEFVHCFTGFLTGRASPGTPSKVVAGPYGTENRGEAGWTWCQKTFGGLTHFWYTKGEAPKSDQIGIPTMLEWKEDMENSVFYKVDHSIIKKILKLDFSADKTDRNWMKKIKSAAEPGTPYKEWTRKYKDIVKIWDNGKVIPTIDTATQVASGFATDFAYASALDSVERAIKEPLSYRSLVKVTA